MGCGVYDTMMEKVANRNESGCMFMKGEIVLAPHRGFGASAGSTESICGRLDAASRLLLLFYLLLTAALSAPLHRSLNSLIFLHEGGIRTGLPAIAT